LAATERGGDPSLVAFVVWEGVSRGAGDLTEQFAVSARKRGLPVEEARTDRRRPPA
jgi:hypothetical protein